MSVTEAPTRLSSNERDTSVIEEVRDLPLPAMTEKKRRIEEFIKTHWDEAKTTAIHRFENRPTVLPFLHLLRTRAFPVQLRMHEISTLTTGNERDHHRYRSARIAIGVGQAVGTQDAQRYVFTKTELLHLYVGYVAIGLGLKEEQAQIRLQRARNLEYSES